jgi:TonB family protein
MGSAATHLIIDPAAEGESRGTSQADDRRFFRFLLVAFALHALLLIRVQTAEPRRLGAPGGADDAISVSIITAQDLNGRATVDDRAAGRPAPIPPPPTPQATTPPPPTPPTPPAEQPAPAEPQAAAAPPPPPAAAAPERAEKPTPPTSLRPTLPDEAIEPAPKVADPKPAPEKTEAEKPSEQPTKSDTAADADKPVEKPLQKQKQAEAENPAEAKPKPPAKRPAQKTETAKLDLTPPAVFQAPVGGGGAGVQRPAGITRSGENDDFARGVIRALQSTMPQLRNTFGRVTVRIELNMNGNLVRTTVLKPSNIAGLDQSVVFATQQSSFPFPPRNAVPADLVFFVTYIYR